MSTDSIFRRNFLRTTAAAIGVAGTTITTAGVSAAQGEMPDFSTLEGVDGGTEDLRGEDEVTVEVGVELNDGTFAFAPAGIWIDPGTTVIWEWVTRGQFNVATTGGPAVFKSDLMFEKGSTFEFEFTEEHVGITNYEDEATASLGMLGAVAVGDSVPTVVESDTDGSATEGGRTEPTDDSSGETSVSAPGFGIGGTLAGIGSVGYLLRRRLLADDEQ